jgi:hypothetical protein
MAFLTIKGAKPFLNCARLQATIQRWVCAAYNGISEWRRRSHASARIAGKPVIGKLIKGAQGLNQNSRLE